MNEANKNYLLNNLLCNANIKMPISSTHYLTSKNLVIFKNLACIENSLTNATLNIKNACCNLKNIKHRDK